MSEDLPKYRNPVWNNKAMRSLHCDILSNGEYMPCVVNAGPADEGFVNKDFDAILEIFGEEVIDANTAEIEEEKKLQADKHEEQKQVHLNRMKQEALFNAKLEAFEIDLIKNSEDKVLKKKIRQAKTIIEVTAWTTILLQSEHLNESTKD